MKNKFYITTPVYYVNAKPHLGHAYTTIAADCLARFHKLNGDETFFLVGTDEHGLKNQKKAEEAGKDPQEFVDEISAEFKKLWESLEIEYSNFIRTTSPNHKKAVQKVLEKLFEKGAIYKGEYEGLYCVGCEQFLHEKDLVNGKCPDHDQVPEKVKEENYMLKMTEIQEELKEKIKKDEFKIEPEKYKKEILSFLENQKLEDISISRNNVSWGIPLPFDSKHTAYVWIDAFLNYLTGLDWEGDEKKVPEIFPPDIQLMGKDILRVHATIWPAILIHLGIDLPKKLFIHGHILSGGKKMSKTLENVIDPFQMMEKFGTDATRYLLLSAGTFGEDVDVTMERMVETYNADLPNGLGNLVSRVIKMSQSLKIDQRIFRDRVENFIKNDIDLKEIEDWYENQFEKLKLEQILYCIWLGTEGGSWDEGKQLSQWKLQGIKQMNELIEKNKPWKMEKESEEFENIMVKLFTHLTLYCDLLQPFLPETSQKIKKALETGKAEILFPKIK